MVCNRHRNSDVSFTIISRSDVLAYPSCHSDILYRFGKTVPQICLVRNQIFHIVVSHFGRLLQDMNNVGNTVYRKSTTIDNVWGLSTGL